MLVNADFSRRAKVEPHEYEWVASPEPGVDRVMLDRVGAEKARATSIVKYAPDSRFFPHAHPAGEEILVLSGVFSEGERHYPAGWYLRNPPGSSHQPGSAPGAIIFVKLRQMGLHEVRPVRIDTRDPAQWRQYDDRAVCPLYADDTEQVRLERWHAGHNPRIDTTGGAELLVLEGELRLDGHVFPRGSWLRFPPGDHPDLAAAGHEATVYLKTGHLADRIANHPAQ